MTLRVLLVLSLMLGCVRLSADVPIEGDTVVCAGSWPVSLRAPSGLQSYAWNTGQNTREIFVTKQGLYTVIVMRATGPDTGEIFVREVPKPKPFIGDTKKYICRGDVVTLDAPPGFVLYVWSTGERKSYMQTDTSGFFSLTVTDANGCVGTSDVTEVVVVDRPRPTITGPYTVCFGARALYETEAITGAIYKWNVVGGVVEAGQGTPIARVYWPSGSGSVELHIDVPRPDGGFCDTMIRYPVRVGPRLLPNLSFSKLQFCIGDSTTLDAGGGFVAYKWSTGETTRTITVKTAGRYWAEVWDATGCVGTTDTQTITVLSPPDVRINGDSSLCPGETSVLTAFAIANDVTQWQWSNGFAQKSIFVTEPGTYTVVGRNANGCLDSASITVLSAAQASIIAPDSIVFDSLEVNSTQFRPFLLQNRTTKPIRVLSARLASGRQNPKITAPLFPSTIAALDDLAFVFSWFDDVEGPYSDTLLIEIDGPECPTTVRIPVSGYRFLRAVIPFSISIGEAVVPVGTELEMPIHITATAPKEEFVTLEFSVRWNNFVYYVTDLDPSIVVADNMNGRDRTVRYRLGPLRIPIDTMLILRGVVLLGYPLETDLVPESATVTGTSRYTIATDPGHIGMVACNLPQRLILFGDAEPLTIITNMIGETIATIAGVATQADMAQLTSGRYIVTVLTGTTMHSELITVVR